MKSLIKPFWDIGTLQGKPQDLPHSLGLLLVVSLVNAVVGTLQFSLQFHLFDALWHSVWMMSVTLVFTLLVLQFSFKPNRFVQTGTALMGIGALLTLIAYPVLFLQSGLQGAEPTLLLLMISAVSLLVLISVNVWILVVNAHIFRCALDMTFLVGMFVTLALIGVTIILFNVFFPMQPIV